MASVEINPELFGHLAFWSSILILKVMLMSVLTGRQRMKKKVFVNEEDLSLDTTKKAKIKFDDPDVERVRRAHLNDLENCLPWFIMTLIYLTTNPQVAFAKVLIRTFVFARITHTISYAVLAQQPTRAIAFFVGFLVTGYEAFATLMHYL